MGLSPLSRGLAVFFLFLFALCLLAYSVTMALPVVAGAANPWAMADAPADGPAGVAVAEGQPAAVAAAAEGAEQPALAVGPAPVLGVLDGVVARQQMEKYVLFSHCQFRIYRSVRDLACSTCCHLNHRYLAMARDLAKEKRKSSMLAEQMEELRTIREAEGSPSRARVEATETLREAQQVANSA
jgi:hypothetical protein